MFGQPSPAQVRAALVAHVARKFGWSSKSADTLLAGLTGDDIARCLHQDPAATRDALFGRVCRALAEPTAPPAALFDAQQA